MSACLQQHKQLRLVLLIVNSVFIAVAIGVAIVIRRQRAGGTHVSTSHAVPPPSHHWCLIVAAAVRVARLGTHGAAAARRGTAVLDRECSLPRAAALLTTCCRMQSVIDYCTSPARVAACCLVTWARELGFAIFYGAIVLKVYR